MTIENVKTNIAPSLTWNWLKSNNDVVSILRDDSDFSENNGKIAENVQGISVENIDFCDFARDFPQNLSGVFNKANPKPADLRSAQENKAGDFKNGETKSDENFSGENPSIKNKNENDESGKENKIKIANANEKNKDESDEPCGETENEKKIGGKVGNKNEKERKFDEKIEENKKSDGAVNNDKTVVGGGTEKSQSFHPIENIILKTAKTPKTIVIGGQNQNPFIVNFDFNSPSVNNYNIFAKENSLGVVIFVYRGNADSLIKTNIYAAENSNLKIIKVQLLGKNCLNVDDTAIFQKENSKVHFVQIELGGKRVNSGLRAVLKENGAKFVSNAAYFAKGERLFDMNHIVEHYGKKTESKMNVQGSLKDDAKKTYRGTIDFKKGCVGAKGVETEEALLLSPKVVNKSLPIILCDEEDVEGEHGATIGKLSSQTLFYMQTRGISEEVAQIMFSQAKIQAAADLIPDENIKNEISDFLDKA